eukprot:m.269990 g.269990  ORF g.269990 m.269990 type:complete len:258 (+) comp40542_c0_seq15:41-814(+)
MSGELSVRQFKKDDFRHSELLGFGGFAEVYKAELKKDGTIQVVAAKVLFGRHLTPKDLKSLRKEAKILGRIEKHDNVVKLIGVCQSPYTLLLEFVDGVDLGQVIHSDESLPGDDSSSGSDSSVASVGHLGIDPWNVRLNIAIQTAEGMKHLHKNNIVHLDLKPANVLLKLNENKLVCCKVADFGLSKAREVSSRSTRRSSENDLPPGTLMYISPERYEGGCKHDLDDLEVLKKSDVWSFGVLLWELRERKDSSRGFI